MFKFCIIFCLLLFNLTFAKVKVYIIGDSLIVGSRQFLIQLLDDYDIQIDAKVGRHFNEVFTKIKIIETNSIAIINLFNNSPVSYKKLELLTKELLSKNIRIIFINTHVQRSWRDYNNKNLQKLATNYPQIYILDWYNLMNKFCYNMQCLQKDGVHLTIQGYYYYALSIQFIITTISSYHK